MIVLQANKHFDYANHFASKQHRHRTKTRYFDIGVKNRIGREIIASKKALRSHSVTDDVLTDAIIKFYSKSIKYYDPYQVVMAGVKIANNFNFYQEFGEYPRKSYKLFDTGSKLIGILRDLDLVSGGKNILADLANNISNLYQSSNEKINEFMLSPKFEIFEGFVGAILGFAPLMGHISELAAVAAKLTSGALVATTVIGVVRGLIGTWKTISRSYEYSNLIDEDRLQKRIEALEKIEGVLASYKKEDQLPESLRKELHKFFVEEEMDAMEYMDFISQIERDYRKVGVLRKRKIRQAQENREKNGK